MSTPPPTPPSARLRRLLYAEKFTARGQREGISLSPSSTPQRRDRSASSSSSRDQRSAGNDGVPPPPPPSGTPKKVEFASPLSQRRFPWRRPAEGEANDPNLLQELEDLRTKNDRLKAQVHELEQDVLRLSAFASDHKVGGAAPLVCWIYDGANAPVLLAAVPSLR